MSARITDLFGIKYPIVQGGMVWCSGWRLASAVSNGGGLGLIGSGSMYPEVLQEHITKCQAATDQPFGVNVPLLYPDIDKHMKTIINAGIKIVFTSAGNPKTWTSILKSEGIKVVHVVSSVKFALKAQDAGVDAVVAEGFEAGGHNGREETTTMCLIPEVSDALDIPVIAAGGVGSGRAIAAALALGAEGVQIGSLFAASEESSAHPLFKEKILATEEGGTKLMLKQLAPVRLVKNKFFEQVALAEAQGSNAEELRLLLGKGRAKKGMFEGELDEGELEIGQVASSIKSIMPVSAIIDSLWKEFLETKKKFSEW